MLATYEFAVVMADAARTLNRAQTLDEASHAIVEAAPASLPGFDNISIATMVKQEKPQTRALVGDLAARLDAIQYDLHEGPCSAALQGSDAVAASSMRHEQRWPRYVPEALAAGVRSQLSVRLHIDGGFVGGINLYSTVSDHVSPETQALARLFAIHAATALGQAHERETMNQALQSRKVIGQAIGILMERYQIDEDGAFAFLVRASTHANTKLRVIAQRLVDEPNHRVVVEDRDSREIQAANTARAAERRSNALLREEATQAQHAAHDAQVRAETVRSRNVKRARTSRIRFEQALVRLETAQSELERTDPGQAVGNRSPGPTSTDSGPRPSSPSTTPTS